MRCYFTFHYADWCGHCTKVKPTYKQLKQHYQNDDRVRIQSCECEKNESCKNTSYPTFIFKAHPAPNETVEETYPGNAERSLESMCDFIDRNIKKVTSQ